MRSWAAFAIIVVALGAALVVSERRKAEAPVGPEPILNLIADTEHELTRLPVAFAPLADSEEVKIGKSIEKSYADMWRHPEGEQQTRAIEAYVQQVGSRVAANAHRKLPYRFHYIPELDFVNAFALPGGPVYIGEGLLALMETEDQLAAVLGHELEHIDHRHCAERVQIQAALRHAPLGGLMGIPVEVFAAGYSKTQELEADREGTKLAAAASYSPFGALTMFEAFDRAYPAKRAKSNSPEEELSGIALQTLEGYFRSHPLTAERIDQIRKMIADGQLPRQEKTRPLPIAFYFLTDRAWQTLQKAEVPTPSWFPENQKREREAERQKQYRLALKLANQSVALRPDQPRALQVVAISSFGLGDYSAATAAYRSLLAVYPIFADGVRQHADTLARQALAAQHYAEAARLANASLELQPDQEDALKILSEAQLHLADFAGAAVTCRKLAQLHPEGASEIAAYAAQMAHLSYGAHRYQAALDLVSQALALAPLRIDSQALRADALFALGDFSSAAAAYRKLLDPFPTNQEFIRRCAESLAAGSPNTAAYDEFLQWLAVRAPAAPALAAMKRVEWAGLVLRAGANQNPLPDSTSLAPELTGRLGWWFYRVGNYSMAATLLNRAIAQRPGDLAIQSNMAWNDLELHRPDEALRRFTAVLEHGTPPFARMGRAVARWRLRQTEDAVRDFAVATNSAPEWLNPAWVKGLYPPGIAQTIFEFPRPATPYPSAPVLARPPNRPF
ncbi:MAG: M48 family metalloprotease [Bryobacteraceae bacterium]